MADIVPLPSLESGQAHDGSDSGSMMEVTLGDSQGESQKGCNFCVYIRTFMHGVLSHHVQRTTVLKPSSCEEAKPHAKATCRCSVSSLSSHGPSPGTRHGSERVCRWPHPPVFSAFLAEDPGSRGLTPGISEHNTSAIFMPPSLGIICHTGLVTETSLCPWALH